MLRVLKNITLSSGGLIFIAMLCCTSLVGQEVSVQSTKSQLRGLKKQYRQQLRSLTNESKRFKGLLDEFTDVADSVKSLETMESFAKLSTMVKSKLPQVDKEQLFQEGEERIPKRYKKQYQRYSQQWSTKKEEWQRFTRQDSTFKGYWEKLKSDTALMAKAEEKLVEHFKKELGENPFGESIDPSKQMKQVMSDFEGLADPKAAYEQLTKEAFNYSGEELKGLTKDQIIGPLAGKDNIVEQAHNSMWELKRKYSFVQNSDDLSTAIKAKSLQDQSFDQRLRLGGNFRFVPVNKGLKIDLSPTLGFALNRDLIFGLGVVYRANFGKTDSTNEPSSVFGARMFVQQTFWRGIFFHAEGELVSTEQELPNETDMVKEDTIGFLAGVGREFRFIKGLNASALWLYHFNHSKTLAYRTPWVFRLGFNLRKENK